MAKLSLPTLSQLLADLKALERAGHLQSGEVEIQGGGKFSFNRGALLARLSWPGAGDYHLTRPQQEVMAVLLDAYLNCRNCDVGERHLLEVAQAAAPPRSKRYAKLAQVFEGCDEWRTLVIPGNAPATWRIIEAGGPSEEPPITRGDDERGEWIEE